MFRIFRRTASGSLDETDAIIEKSGTGNRPSRSQPTDATEACQNFAPPTSVSKDHIEGLKSKQSIDAVSNVSEHTNGVHSCTLSERDFGAEPCVPRPELGYSTVGPAISTSSNHLVSSAASEVDLQLTPLSRRPSGACCDFGAPLAVKGAAFPPNKVPAGNHSHSQQRRKSSMTSDKTDTSAEVSEKPRNPQTLGHETDSTASSNLSSGEVDSWKEKGLLEEAAQGMWDSSEVEITGTSLSNSEDPCNRHLCEEARAPKLCDFGFASSAKEEVKAGVSRFPEGDSGNVREDDWTQARKGNELNDGLDHEYKVGAVQGQKTKLSSVAKGDTHALRTPLGGPSSSLPLKLTRSIKDKCAPESESIPDSYTRAPTLACSVSGKQGGPSESSQPQRSENLKASPADTNLRQCTVSSTDFAFTERVQGDCREPASYPTGPDKRKLPGSLEDAFRLNGDGTPCYSQDGEADAENRTIRREVEPQAKTVSCSAPNLGNSCDAYINREPAVLECGKSTPTNVLGPQDHNVAAGFVISETSAAFDGEESHDLQSQVERTHIENNDEEAASGLCDATGAVRMESEESENSLEISATATDAAAHSENCSNRGGEPVEESQIKPKGTVPNLLTMLDQSLKGDESEEPKDCSSCQLSQGHKSTTSCTTTETKSFAEKAQAPMRNTEKELSRNHGDGSSDVAEEDGPTDEDKNEATWNQGNTPEDINRGESRNKGAPRNFERKFDAAGERPGDEQELTEENQSMLTSNDYLTKSFTMSGFASSLGTTPQPQGIVESVSFSTSSKLSDPSETKTKRPESSPKVTVQKNPSRTCEDETGRLRISHGLGRGVRLPSETEVPGQAVHVLEVASGGTQTVKHSDDSESQVNTNAEDFNGTNFHPTLQLEEEALIGQDVGQREGAHNHEGYASEPADEGDVELAVSDKFGHQNRDRAKITIGPSALTRRELRPKIGTRRSVSFNIVGCEQEDGDETRTSSHPQEGTHLCDSVPLQNGGSHCSGFRNTNETEKPAHPGRNIDRGLSRNEALSPENDREIPSKTGCPGGKPTSKATILASKGRRSVSLKRSLSFQAKRKALPATPDNSANKLQGGQVVWGTSNKTSDSIPDCSLKHNTEGELPTTPIAEIQGNAKDKKGTTQELGKRSKSQKLKSKVSEIFRGSGAGKSGTKGADLSSGDPPGEPSMALTEGTAENTERKVSSSTQTGKGLRTQDENGEIEPIVVLKQGKGQDEKALRKRVLGESNVSQNAGGLSDGSVIRSLKSRDVESKAAGGGFGNCVADNDRGRAMPRFSNADKDRSTGLSSRLQRLLSRRNSEDAKENGEMEAK